MYIAKVNDLSLQVPPGTWYSFFNSPYIGHREGTAIDIYYPDKPVYPLEEGTVSEIKKIRTPSNIPINEDFLIIIKLNEETCLKVLHVKPAVNIGDKIYRGDEFGEMILSGFFMPWSDKHVHLEIRKCNDKYRARGGYPLVPILQENVPSTSQNIFEVVEKKEEYYWLKPTNKDRAGLTPINYENFSIEGGLPYYEYGAIFGKRKNLNLFNMHVSCSHFLHNAVGIFDARFKIYANRQRIRGIGIYCNQEKIKLVGGTFNEGDILKIHILKEKPT